MSAPPAPVVAQPVVSSSPGILSVAWARVVGAGAIRRDFGHHVATNAASEVLLAARLDRLGEGATGACAGLVGDPACSPPPDLKGGRLIKLAAAGGPAWSVLLRNGGRLSAPSVALDDAGAAYVAGPFTPDTAGLCGAREVTLTKLGPGGTVEWSRPLLLVRTREGRPCVPMVRVAADPAGGACVTWIGERRGAAVVRAVRVSGGGSIEWEYAWPIVGNAVEPHVGVDGGGAAVVWGTFRGTVLFGPRREARSHVEARYLARVEPDGRVSWAHPLCAEEEAPHAVGVARNGTIGLATVVRPAPRRGRAALRALALLRLDAAGAPLKRLQGVCGAHALVSSLSLTPTGGDGFALAGYFAGTVSLGGAALRSPTPAGEAVFVACAGPEGVVAARVLPAPQLSGGLSVHDAGDGAVLVSAWVCGALTLGGHKIVSPRDRAVLLLVKLVPR